MSCHENAKKQRFHGWTNPVLITAVKGSLASIHQMLQRLLLITQNLLSAPAPATPALVLGPDFLALHPAAKLVL
jgi:hypothetical protein